MLKETFTLHDMLGFGLLGLLAGFLAGMWFATAIMLRIDRARLVALCREVAANTHPNAILPADGTWGMLRMVYDRVRAELVDLGEKP